MTETVSFQHFQHSSSNDPISSDPTPSKRSKHRLSTHDAPPDPPARPQGCKAYR